MSLLYEHTELYYISSKRILVYFHLNNKEFSLFYLIKKGEGKYGSNR